MIFLAFTRIFQSSKGKEQQLLQKGPWEVLFLAIGSLAGPKQGKGTGGARRPVSGGAGRRRRGARGGKGRGGPEHLLVASGRLGVAGSDGSASSGDRRWVCAGGDDVLVR